jgi:hypothetical protein
MTILMIFSEADWTLSIFDGFLGGREILKREKSCILPAEGRAVGIHIVMVTTDERYDCMERGVCIFEQTLRGRIRQARRTRQAYWWHLNAESRKHNI